MLRSGPRLTLRGISISICTIALLTTTTAHPLADHVAHTAQLPFFPVPDVEGGLVQTSALPPPSLNMTMHALHTHTSGSGSWADKVDLTFFSDGYTANQEHLFLRDAKALTADIISPGGALARVAPLLNIYAVFVPSREFGIGTHDAPLPGAAFGLYRPGAELRAVFVQHEARARAACAFWRENGRAGGKGGCDQPILLGNDPLYGGLGGEFTIITASKLNGPLVLRHELGHSLIGVGEEYEGGYVYSGVNSDKPSHLASLKWADQLSLPPAEGRPVRIEDARLALQAYPWHNLSAGAYTTTLPKPLTVPIPTLSALSTHHEPAPAPAPGSESASALNPYPSALLRLSLSSIPHASHISLQLNSRLIDLTSAFPAPPSPWAGSLDRRWLEVPLPAGLAPFARPPPPYNDDNESDLPLPRGPGNDASGDGWSGAGAQADARGWTLTVSLTPEGRARAAAAEAGQGGKMLSSIEIVEYGPEERFNSTPGHISAYPTWSEDGRLSLRPTNEECLMRKVNHPAFCPVCERGLERALHRRMKHKRRELSSEMGAH